MKKGINRKHFSGKFNMDEFNPAKMQEMRRRVNGTVIKNGKCETYYKRNVRNILNSLIGYECRRKFTSTFGWNIVTKEQIDLLVTFMRGKKVLDIGAGGGFLSSQLHRRKIDVKLNDYTPDQDGCLYKRQAQFMAIDFTGPICDVDITGFNAFIMSWPSYGESWTSGPLRRMKSGDILFYQGENSGGCTGDDSFHEILQNDFVIDNAMSDSLNKNHFQFYGIRDWWFVYVKK